MHALILIAALSQQIIPAGSLVQGGLADAREPRVAVGYIKSNIFKDPLIARPRSINAKTDTHGVVELGIDFPMARIKTVTLSLQGGLVSRFRLDTSDNDALSSDYVVALPLHYVINPWEARLRVMHRSGHVGDETVINSGITRLEFDHEEVDGLVARRFGPFRVYGGGSVTLASSFVNDKWGLQIGSDFRQPLGGNWNVVAGIDWQRHSINEGNSRFGAVAGLQRIGPGGKAALNAVFQSGASAMGEFFLERERYWGFALVLER